MSDRRAGAGGDDGAERPASAGDDASDRADSQSTDAPSPGSSGPSSDREDEFQWAQPVDETADGSADADSAESGSGDEEPSVAAIFGATPEDAPPRPEIVPETPSLENVAFVLLGVLFGLFVVWRAVAVFTA